MKILKEENLRLKDELQKIRYKNLYKTIMSICPRCGHTLSEDGCLNCFREDLKKESGTPIKGSVFVAKND